MFFYIYISFVLVILSSAAGQDAPPCITPNGENATCVPIKTCKVIVKAIAYLDEDAIEFAKKSHCGYDNDTHLVCCGTQGRFSAIPSIVPEDAVSSPRTTQPAISTTATPPTPIDNILLPDNSLCGIQNKEDRIVGGLVTDIGEFPWMVALRYINEEGTDGGYRCSGTLISQKYIMTAAQCIHIKGYILTEARLGEWNFSTPIDCALDEPDYCADPVVDVRITQQIAHPYYSRRSGNNDIALLRLETKVNYTDFIRPICLPPNDYPPPNPGTIMQISGWGVTDNGNRSDVKLKLKVPMVQNEVCAKVFPNYTHVNPNQACAGGEEGRDACYGDAGGPLMRTYAVQEYGEQQWFQEGIIYRGFGCGQKGVPSLYTRVSRYINWIINTIRP